MHTAPTVSGQKALWFWWGCCEDTLGSGCFLAHSLRVWEFTLSPCDCGGGAQGRGGAELQGSGEQGVDLARMAQQEVEPAAVPVLRTSGRGPVDFPCVCWRVLVVYLAGGSSVFTRGVNARCIVFPRLQAEGVSVKEGSCVSVVASKSYWRSLQEVTQKGHRASCRSLQNKTCSPGTATSAFFSVQTRLFILLC